MIPLRLQHISFLSFFAPIFVLTTWDKHGRTNRIYQRDSVSLPIPRTSCNRMLLLLFLHLLSWFGKA
jgi:hypothetical protein